LIAVCHFYFVIKAKKTEQIKRSFFETFAADDSAVEFAMENLLIRWGVKIKAGDNSALDSMSLFARLVLTRIFNLANGGNESAAKEFYKIIASQVVQFNEFSHRNAEFFEPIARKRTAWPSFISKHKSINKQNEKLIAKLHLGEDVKSLDAKGNWSYDAPEIKAAVWLHSTMEIWREEWSSENVKRNREQFREWEKERSRINKQIAKYAPQLKPIPKKVKPVPTNPKWEEEFRLQRESRNMAKNLPPFNKQTYEQWFKASIPLFESRYKKDYENRKCFVRFVPIAQKIADNEKKKLDGILRKYIRERISAAFEKIAPEVELKTQI
jgi:hypothetical protein